MRKMNFKKTENKNKVMNKDNDDFIHDPYLQLVCNNPEIINPETLIDKILEDSFELQNLLKATGLEYHVKDDLDYYMTLIGDIYEDGKIPILDLMGILCGIEVDLPKNANGVDLIRYKIICLYEKLNFLC